MTINLPQPRRSASGPVGSDFEDLDSERLVPDGKLVQTQRPTMRYPRKKRLRFGSCIELHAQQSCAQCSSSSSSSSLAGQTIPKEARLEAVCGAWDPDLMQLGGGWGLVP